MRSVLFILPMLAFTAACNTSTTDMDAELAARAEGFFRGVYGCNPPAVDTLAADDVVSSYPIFAELYDTPAFRGRDAVRAFAEGFCSRWKDAQFTFHESVVDEDDVVLVWSFRARFAGDESANGPVPGEEQAWGGITLFKFDSTGKIVAEIGEESAPGPMERVAAGSSPR